MRKYKRVYFDFSKKSLRRLDYLVEETNASCRAEVLREALKAYEKKIKGNDFRDSRDNIEDHFGDRI